MHVCVQVDQARELLDMVDDWREQDHRRGAAAEDAPDGVAAAGGGGGAGGGSGGGEGEGPAE